MVQPGRVDKRAGAAGDSRSAGPAARQRAFRTRAVRVMLGLVFVTVAFAAGFFVRGNTELMVSLGFVQSSSKADSAGISDTLADVRVSVSARVKEVERILTTKSMDTYDLDSTTSSLINAFAKATEDPYFQYLDASRYANYVKETSSTAQAGIGVLFAEYEGQIYAAEVFPESAAEFAGVQQGDYVVAIDGEQVGNLTVTEAVKRLTRDPGETVLITWRRPTSLEATGGDEFATSLECAEYREGNVSTELSGTVGVISIAQFTENAADLVSAGVSELAALGAESYVLDLRDCPGGYLTQAVDTASLFVKSGTVVQIKTNEGTTTKTANGQTVTDKPLVVLVNGSTAAAAEVLAAALKDSSSAIVVGTNTMGKGSVQVVTELSFGGAIRYTAAHYLSPSGQDLNDYGVAPDVVADDADDQLSTAIAIARTLS